MLMSPVCIKVRPQVRQVHVEVAIGQQRVEQGGEDTGLVPAEVTREDQVQDRTRLGLVVVMPVRAVPPTTAGDLILGQLHLPSNGMIASAGVLRG